VRARRPAAEPHAIDGDVLLRVPVRAAPAGEGGAGAGGRHPRQRALGDRQATLSPVHPAGESLQRDLRPPVGPHRLRDVRLLLGDRLRVLGRLRRRARLAPPLTALSARLARPGPPPPRPFGLAPPPPPPRSPPPASL